MVGGKNGTRHPAVSPADIALAARREADRQRREMADLNRPPAEPPAAHVPLSAPRLTGSPPPPPPRPGAPVAASEPCPECGAPILLDDAWCRSCGSSRGVSTSTPREDYLRACISALELVRQTSSRVRPLPETRRAEMDLEAAIERLRAGCEL
jgi:hypothetical protein